MPHPLLFLSALIALARAQQISTPSSVLNTSSCPITYYGKKYEQLYVNSTTENFALCFDGFFKTQTGGDCLVGPAVSYVTLNINSKNSKLESQVHQEVPSIKASMKCNLEFFMEFTNTTRADLYLLIFGKQAALFVFTDVTTKVDLEVYIGGIKVTTVYKNTIQDISGCRHSGIAYEPDTVVSSDPETCSKLTCSNTAVLETIGCGALERCQGNNTCVVDTTCTVTGPTIVNVHGQVNFIKDRCAYSLVYIPSIPNFYLVANFRERRREDVSFLDSVILRLDGPGVHIHLEQGGRVWLDDSTLTLDSSPQLVHGVQLSKDQTGVTAKLSLSNLTISVFFDGYTAQIHLKAYTDAGRTQVVQLNSEVRLNQRIWVELETNGLDGSMVTVVSDSCWATNQASPTSSPRHDLIINGCANPADLTVAVEENELGTSTLFSFNMFRFTGGSGEVYLHCQLHLCPKEETSCIPNCNAAARRHRSVGSKYEGEASIGMSWTH